MQAFRESLVIEAARWREELCASQRCPGKGDFQSCSTCIIVQIPLPVGVMSERPCSSVEDGRVCIIEQWLLVQTLAKAEIR